MKCITKKACLPSLTENAPAFSNRRKIIKVCYLPNQLHQDVFPDSMEMTKNRNVTEICIGIPFLLVIYENGMCSVYEEESGKFISFLNKPDQTIKTVYNNAMNHSLLVVANEREFNWYYLKIYSFPQGSIDWSEARSLLGSDAISTPGYLEIDDCNGLILAKLTGPPKIKVWSMVTYQELYSFSTTDIEEVRFGMHMIAMMSRIIDSQLKISIASTATGKYVNLFKIVHNDIEFDYIEIFGKYLLLKQKGKCMQTIHCLSLKKCVYPNSQHLSPKAFIFVPEKKVFYAFEEEYVMLYKVRHGLVEYAKKLEITMANPNAHMCYSKTKEIIYLYYRQTKCFNTERPKSFHADRSLEDKENMATPLKRQRKLNRPFNDIIIGITTGNTVPTYIYKGDIADELPHSVSIDDISADSCCIYASEGKKHYIRGQHYGNSKQMDN